MKMFESFNFDIIIVLILISSIISGLYFNLYRQGRRTLGLILPITILFFTFNIIFETIKNISFIDDFLNKVLVFFKIVHKETAYAVIIYFISFFVLSLLIRLFYSFFRVPVQKRVLNKTTPMTRVLCAFLGLLNGYVIGMLLMLVLNPFIGLNYTKPITKIYTETSNDVITFSSLNQVKNVNVKRYENVEEILGELTGRNALNEYYKILDTFKEFEEIEEEFITVITPSLSTTSKVLINEEDILRSFIVNSKVILTEEKANPQNKRIKEIQKFLNNYKSELTLYNFVSNADFETISEYLITNEESLLNELDKALYRDNLIRQLNIIKRYVENKDEYLALINYTSIDIQSDVVYYENMLTLNTDEVITAYKQKYGSVSLDYHNDLNDLFDIYTKNKEVIDNLNPNLSLSVKLILGSKYNYYFKGDSIFKNKLLRSYIIDSITNKDSLGYKLYSEYVFYSKLAYGIDLAELSKDEFIVILNNLNKLVIDGFIQKEQAIIYFQNLFSYDNNIFFNLLTDELIEEIKTIDNDYLSEEIFTLLG